MDRRLFIKQLPIFGYFFWKAQNALAKTLPSFLLPSSNSSQNSRLLLQPENGQPIHLEIWWKHNLAYVSTFQLAKGLNYHTYLNDAKKKIVLYFPDNQVVVTANNVFVIIDDVTYQLPAPALWHSREIYAPVKYFIPLLNRRTTIHFNYNEDRQTLRMSQPDVNITAATISAKENGTVIRIHTTKEFQSGEITADMRYGWLHVDFYGGKVDERMISKAQTAGLVTGIKTFQFSELASLAFRLKQKPLSEEIIPKPQNSEVLVVLRTKEDLSEEQMAELREENPDNPEPPEEIKRQLEEERKKWLIDTVVIDPGHGGKDPGAIGIGKAYEKDIVLAIAKRLGRIIQKELPEVKVIYTRTSDKFVSLKRRTQIANENNSKVFISIHANSISQKRVSGFETYILGPQKGEMAREVVLKENSVISFEDESVRKEYKGINQILATMAQNAFSRQSEYLASLVQQQMTRQLRSVRLPSRGVKQGPFWVLVGATMPNILVESGFLTNPYDVKILKTAAYQYKIAQGIFQGFRRFKRDYENAI